MKALPSNTAVAAFALLLVLGPRVAAGQDASKQAAPAATGQAGAPATEQESGPVASRDISQEIVRIEHANVEDLPAVLRVFNVHAQAHPSLGILTLHGPRDKVAAAAAAARELDVAPAPTPSLEVTVFVLGASKTRALGGSLPSNLDEVADQLRTVFGFKGVDLLDSMSVRALDRGDGGIQGILPASDGVPALPYSFGFNRATLIDRGASDRSVRLTGFRFEAATPRLLNALPTNLKDSAAPAADFQTTLATDVEVRAGQTAVVGRAATAGSRDGLILVVRSRVVE